MPVITTIRPTTELQAVNTMLGAIGEAPLASGTDLATEATTNANVEVAIEILKETSREILASGWKFNTLTGLEVAPTTTYAWTDTDGVTTTLNIFKVNAEWLAWKQTPCHEMRDVELVERLSLKYTEAAAKVLVLFDRVRNRDGLDSSTYPYIYIDPVYSVDFEKMPESARRFITIVSARRLAQRVPGSGEQAGFQEVDQQAAFRLLKKDQGLSKQLNLFDTLDGWEMGGRRQHLGGGYRTKVYPGGAA